MREIEKKQFAAMNLIYLRCSLEYFLDSLQRLSIPNVELWGVSPFFCTLDESTSRADKIKKLLRERGLRLISFIPEQCTNPLNLASREKEIQNRTIAFYREHIKIAAELEAGKVLVTPGWGCRDESSEEARKRSREGLAAIISAARQEGVELVLENLQPCESNLLYNLETMQWYAEEFSQQELGFCVDTVPVKLAGERLEQYFQNLGGRIRHIHLVDGTPTGHMAWGDGTHLLEEHLDALAEHDYGGYITLEFGNSAYLMKPELHMKRGWDYLKRKLPYGGDRYEG